jgi:RNA polymerase sigma-70 factor (ECF subfamily)
MQLQNLLDRYRAGDESAKAQLIDRAYQRLLVVARRLLGSFPAVRVDEETAGVLGDAYASLAASMAELKPQTVRQFMALATLEIRRSLLDRMRKLHGRGKQRRNRPTSLSSGSDDGEGRAQGIDVPVGGEENERSSLALDMLDAIETLPDEEREAVDLLFFQSLTQIEAAEVVGVSEDTIKRRWSRARIRLAKYLGEFSEAAT